MPLPITQTKFGKILACRNRPIVYGKVPKSACTTIQNLMYLVDTGRAYPEPVRIHGDKGALIGHEEAEALRRAIDQSLIRFTFVRDPARRIYSTFTQKILTPPSPAFRRAHNILTSEFGADFGSADATATPEEIRKNFELFLRFVGANLRGETSIPVNLHWIPQATLVDWYRTQLDLNFIGRVENFAADMAHVFRAAGISENVDVSVRFNEGPASRYRLEEILSSEIAESIAELYSRDFQEFTYAPPVAA